MSVSRRKMIFLVGGGAVLAAGATFAYTATRLPRTASTPWQTASDYEDPRMRALSWALLAPNPHNRQPWIADLAEPNIVTLYAEPTRMLPHTDPSNRQITIGLGCFLELMRMAAAEDGQRVQMTMFPEGSNSEGLDSRPVARAVFTADAHVPRDPLFKSALDRRSNKEPFDTSRTIDAGAIARIGKAVANGCQFGGTVEPSEIAEWRALTRNALLIEIETPRTFQESVDLFRIGRQEVDKNPDGIDFTGPMFETLRMTGMFTRSSAADPSSMAFQAGMDAVFANTDTAMGHLWLITTGNSRADQLASGADWMRVNLASTAEGLGFQPLSQALQEFPEMAALYTAVHKRLAADGGTVQMLSRIGYGPDVRPSPRWPLETRIQNG